MVAAHISHGNGESCSTWQHTGSIQSARFVWNFLILEVTETVFNRPVATNQVNSLCHIWRISIRVFLRYYIFKHMGWCGECLCQIWNSMKGMEGQTTTPNMIITREVLQVKKVSLEPLFVRLFYHVYLIWERQWVGTCHLKTIKKKKAI